MNRNGSDRSSVRTAATKCKASIRNASSWAKKSAVLHALLFLCHSKISMKLNPPNDKKLSYRHGQTRKDKSYDKSLR